MDDTSEFQTILASNPFVAERWAHIVAKASSDAMRLYGVPLSAQDVLSLSECRFAAMGNGKLGADYQEQLLGHPAFDEKKRIAAIKAGDVEQTVAAVKEVLTIQKRSDRMAAARRLGVENVGAEPERSGLSKSDAITLLLTLPPGQRLAVARRWNLA